MTAARWGRRVGLWSAALFGFCILLEYDVHLMRWRARVIGEDLSGWAKQLVVGLRDFGQVLPIVVVLIVIATYDRRRKTIIITVLLAQLLASIAYNSGKSLIGRYRPYQAVKEIADLQTLTVEQTWIGWHLTRSNNHIQSFPSGHSGAAFAFAGVLMWFYPQLRWLLWSLATGCAASRYIDGVHWPSDCHAGAVIGCAAAWLALRPYVWLLPFRRGGRT